MCAKPAADSGQLCERSQSGDKSPLQSWLSPAPACSIRFHCFHHSTKPQGSSLGKCTTFRTTFRTMLDTRLYSPQHRAVPRPPKAWRLILPILECMASHKMKSRFQRLFIASSSEVLTAAAAGGARRSRSWRSGTESPVLGTPATAGSPPPQAPAQRLMRVSVLEAPTTRLCLKAPLLPGSAGADGWANGAASAAGTVNMAHPLRRRPWELRAELRGMVSPRCHTPAHSPSGGIPPPKRPWRQQPEAALSHSRPSPTHSASVDLGVR